jgi:hypothetical protein
VSLETLVISTIEEEYWGKVPCRRREPRVFLGSRLSASFGGDHRRCSETTRPHAFRRPVRVGGNPQDATVRQRQRNPSRRRTAPVRTRHRALGCRTQEPEEDRPWPGAGREPWSGPSSTPTRACSLSPPPSFPESLPLGLSSKTLSAPALPSASRPGHPASSHIHRRANGTDASLDLSFTAFSSYACRGACSLGLR